jgi:hypothetical protein
LELNHAHQNPKQVVKKINSAHGHNVDGVMLVKFGLYWRHIAIKVGGDLIDHDGICTIDDKDEFKYYNVIISKKMLDSMVSHKYYWNDSFNWKNEIKIKDGLEKILPEK